MHITRPNQVRNKASVGSARMYKDQYACVTLDGTPTERVVGFVLAIPEDHQKWLEKLSQADDIEGYDASAPDDGLYRRAVVWATQEESGEVVASYIYHRTGRTGPTCKVCRTKLRYW